jgi:hypothetical protein
MWMNSAGSVGSGLASWHVLESRSPLGPFRDTLAPVLVRPIGADHDIFVDDDGTAYRVVSALYPQTPRQLFDNQTLFIERLDRRYHDSTGQTVQVVAHAAHPSCGGQGACGANEGPSMFKRGATYYVLYSDPICAYCATGTSYVRARSPLGPYFGPAGTPMPSQGFNLSRTSCGGQPRAVSAIPTVTGTSYLLQVDLWHDEPDTFQGGEPNQGLANYYWSPLRFRADGSIMPLVCRPSEQLDLAVRTRGRAAQPTDVDASSGADLFQTRLRGRTCAITASRRVAQTFRVSRSGTLTSVALTAFRFRGADKPLDLDLVAADDGRPGPVLASRSFAAEDVGWSARPLVLRLGLAVNAGASLAVVASSPVTRGCYGIAVSVHNPYRDGALLHDDAQTPGWREEPDTDTAFATTATPSR